MMAVGELHHSSCIPFIYQLLVICPLVYQLQNQYQATTRVAPVKIGSDCCLAPSRLSTVLRAQ